MELGLSVQPIRPRSSRCCKDLSISSTEVTVGDVSSDHDSHNDHHDEDVHVPHGKGLSRRTSVAAINAGLTISKACSSNAGAGDAGKSCQLLLVTVAMEYITKALLFPVALPFRIAQASLSMLVGLPFALLSCAAKATVRGLMRQRRAAARLLWGWLWSVYVFAMMVGLLAAAFVAGGLVMMTVAEEPREISTELKFDYTKASPDAVALLRMPPASRRLKVGVLLTMPESDHNRNLGMFQVRAELLSVGGQVMASSIHPCMLQFKGHSMRTLETFLNTAPLLLGYSTQESQGLHLHMMNFAGSPEPVASVRVIIDRRAGKEPGAGIPEIYSASLRLETELSLLKKVIWSWRWTLFVWTSMGVFTLELSTALICCWSALFPRRRLAKISHNSKGKEHHKLIKL